jgi:drug/metabolite transporter (DMT)-like permease
MKWFQSSKTKGYLFALVATVSFSNVYIFSKAAMNEVSIGKFWIYWFAIGLSFNFLFTLFTRSFRVLKGLRLKAYRIFLFLGVLEIATNSTFFLAIQTIPDPSVTSFLGNLYMVFLVILGVVMLKERFMVIESVGVVITLVGAFMVGYQGGNKISDFFVPGTGLVLINTFLAAYTSIVAKKTILRYNPALVNLNQTLFLFVASAIYFLFCGETLSISFNAISNIFIGSLLGPFLGILMIYYSFKYIEASRSSVIQGLKGIFVLIGSLVYLGLMPQPIQLAGGLISVLGVLVMTLPRANLFNFRGSISKYL